MATPSNLANNDIISETWVDAVTEGINGTTWTAVTFDGAWANYPAFQTCKYRMLGNVVQLRGMCVGGASGSSMFTLPTGYRPPLPIIFIAMCSGAVGYIQVNTSGTCVVTGSTAAWVSVDGLYFSVNS